MIGNRWRRTGRSHREAGQALVFMVGADMGFNCTAATAYNSSMGFGGNSGSGTIVGQIVVDQINMHGTPGITMDLNPTTSFSIIKATLLR
jgi:hypothetical protein